MRTTLLPLAALVAAAACYPTGSSGCIQTRTHAEEAEKLDLRSPTGSAVITAALTARNGEALAGRELDFEVLDDSATVYRDEASTARSGHARVDLKRADADALVALVRADAFRASFAGDSTYCASTDEAPIGTVR